MSPTTHMLCNFHTFHKYMSIPPTSHEGAVSIERCSLLHLIVPGASDPRFCLEFDCRLVTICEATNPSSFPIHGATVIPFEIISSVCSRQIPLDPLTQLAMRGFADSFRHIHSHNIEKIDRTKSTPMIKLRRKTSLIMAKLCES